MEQNPLIESIHLTAEEKTFLYTIEHQMGIVADLSRADFLLYGQKSVDEYLVLSHARPRSLAHVYTKLRSGRVVSAHLRPEIVQAFTSGKRHMDQRSVISEGAPVVRETLPIYFPPAPDPWERIEPSGNQPPRVIGALIIVTNLIEHERHKLRSEVYRRQLRKLQAMLLGGLILGAETLSPFGEQDGIIYTDNEGIIRYASGIAANLYRRVGYKETLVGRHLSDLETGDDLFRRESLAQKRCLEEEDREAERLWTRKGIPIINYAPMYWSWYKRLQLLTQPRESGVLLVLHDATDIRRRAQEIRIKNAMIQEVHHRVKNNLQTIAGLLRMQMRRVHSDEARLVLDEALKRILSVAVIHEFLSSGGSSIINIKDVSGRIITQFQQGMLNPEKQIQLRLRGESIFLPARQATACSLIINELLQNAVEHGFEHKHTGFIQLDLEDSGDEVIIRVSDNGDGVPEDFTLENAESLGLQIVKILVEGDLQGQIHLAKGVDQSEGLTIEIVFPKSIFKGEEGWNEHVSL